MNTVNVYEEPHICGHSDSSTSMTKGLYLILILPLFSPNCKDIKITSAAAGALLMQHRPANNEIDHKVN